MSQATAKALVNAKPNETPVIKVEETKPQLRVVNDPPAIEEAKQLPIDERLKKVQHLFALTERREKLVEHLSNVNDFDVDPTGAATLKIDDGNNHRFSISNPAVVLKMVIVAKEMLLDAIKDVDNQIQF
jgi:hypothetical protein